MDIRVANAYTTYSVYNTKNTTAVKKTENAAKNEKTRDEFLLSHQAGDYQAARNVLTNLPDVRTDRINQVKAKIDAGAYNVGAAEVASKILQGWDE
jgi:negative regulator of flagellin synthesis FlgM